MLKLSDLKLGEQAVIKGFKTGCLGYRQQLLAMGLTKGARFTVRGKAPLGCPLMIQVRESILTLRQAEANCLIIDKVSV